MLFYAPGLWQLYGLTLLTVDGLPWDEFALAAAYCDVVRAEEERAAKEANP